MKYSLKDINRFKISSVITFLIGIVALIAGALFALGIIENANGLAFLVLGGCIFLIAAIMFFSDLYGYNKMKKKIASFDEKEILDQLNSHLLHAHTNSKSGRISCFFTEKYVISVGSDIIPVDDIDWTYVQIQNSTPYYVIRLLNNREFRPGVLAYKDAVKPCDSALLKANPKILVGATKENSDKHKERVKEYRSGKKD